MTSDNRSAIEPEKTPLFIGAGVTFTGSFHHAGPADEKAVILGELTGDMEWNGILQVPRGGKVTVLKSLRCREIMVGGQIVGADDDVVIETGLLRLGESASVDVATVSLPPGGLEQSRGSVINAKLRMTKEHPYAEHGHVVLQAVPSPARQLPVLTAVANASDDSGSNESQAVGGQDAVADGDNAARPDLVQVETRTTLAA
jgi:hypothetical protein